MRRSELTGRIFGELDVIGLSEISRNGHSRWHVKCSCGIEKTVLGTHLLSGKVVSCGHIMRESGHRNSKGVGLLTKSYYSSIKRGADGGKGRKPIPFDITMEEMWEMFQDQNGLCKLSRLPINFRTRTASLDRIDSSLGYTRNNCQWLHKDINMMKRHYSQDYFIELCRKVRDKWAEQF